MLARLALYKTLVVVGIDRVVSTINHVCRVLSAHRKWRENERLMRAILSDGKKGGANLCAVTYCRRQL
jgi:hypothetical protein